ncbi:hypothetical protein BGZ76_006733 [Entomortierella beljakovae]|nr:hypothetical protein BGZ76_006733 [Entomortierella beljakovae]
MNLNITAATLHVLGDLLSSIGVLISSLTITFYPHLTFLDPICTFVFSILVILTTIGVFKRSVSILMERVPRGMDIEEVKEAICDIPGVLEVKSLNIWSLTIGQVALAGSVYLQPEIKDVNRATAIVAKTRRMLKSRYKVRECTIQVELYSPHAESSNRHRHSEAATLSSTSINEPMSFVNGKGGSRVSMEALARHDNDVIFSIGDDDLEEMSGFTPARSAGLGQSHLAPNQIIRAGTPLSLYRDSHHSSDDESENEMEQEPPLKTETKRWA